MTKRPPSAHGVRRRYGWKEEFEQPYPYPGCTEANLNEGGNTASNDLQGTNAARAPQTGPSDGVKKP